MSRNILVAVAWPYASADIHVGNLAGSYLPADIFARFQRLRGNNVLMVSGSDAHGTPITLKADDEDSTPEKVYQHYHHRFVDLFQQLGLNYDLFSSTHTQNHHKVAQSIFLALEDQGLIYEEEQEQFYSESLKRFLPDRYVEGTCYICGFEHARGDQCDNCGNILESTKLIDPKAKADGSTPEIRKTSHYFLDLGKLEAPVVEFLEARRDYWRPNVVERSLGWIKSQGLRGRPITRDLDWGIPVPVDGWEDKRLYVWFEAVIGYLSAAIEWSALNDQKDAWHDWWSNEEARSYYFIGKDNIDFHAIMWPAELAGVDTKFSEIFEGKEGKKLNLPYDVPANEFLNMENKQLSGSRNWGVFGLDFLSRYDPDPLRYYLTAIMPESKDSNWDWDDFVSRNNDVLVANWGNLVNRTLTFANKHWEGSVPEPQDLSADDQELLSAIEQGFETVGDYYDKVQLRAALREALRLASEINRYLDEKAPWKQVKEDKAAAGTTVYVAIRAIDSLKTMLAPIIPHSSEAIHRMLSYEKPLFGEQYTEDISDDLGTHTALRYKAGEASGKWEPSQIEGGRIITEPKALFTKLEKEVADEERARLGN